MIKTELLSERAGPKTVSDGTFFTQDDLEDMMGIINETTSPHISSDEEESDVEEDFFVKEEDEH